MPGTVGTADAYKLDVGSPAGEDRIQRKRMAYGEAQVPMHNGTPKHRFSSSVCGLDDTCPNDQGRLVYRVEYGVREWIGVCHDAAA
jgi:hypothetical protein